MRLLIIGGLAAVVVLMAVGGLAYFLSDSAGICSRTPQVQDAILEELARDRPGIRCNEVTPEQLRTVKNLDMVQERVTELKAGDFEGLTNLESIDLFANRLVSLPDGIFDNTPDLKVLNLSDNENLASLPGGIFDNTPDLKILRLSYTKLASLPGGIFDNSNNLEDLSIYDNHLESLDDDIFENLGNLKGLSIGSSNYDDSIRRTPTLSSLPESFYGLTNLRDLYIAPNLISPGIFENMLKLEFIYLASKSPYSCIPREAFGSRTDDFYSIRVDERNNRTIRICS